MSDGLAYPMVWCYNGQDIKELDRDTLVELLTEAFAENRRLNSDLNRYRKDWMHAEAQAAKLARHA